MVTGAAPIANCGIMLAEAISGITARASFRDGVIEVSERTRPDIPRAPALASIGLGVAYWSTSPHVLSLVDTVLTHHDVPLPLHSWGGLWSGPVFDLGRLGVAMVPLGSNLVGAASPDPWTDAPLFFLSADSLKSWVPVGNLTRREGAWLTWYTNRMFLGATQDTLTALMANTGVLERYLHNGPSKPLTPLGKDTLLRLIPYVEPYEHVRSSILAGGGRVETVGFHQVRTAAFLSDGSILAVRPVAVRKSTLRDRDFGWVDRWTIEKYVLEHYTADGSRLGRVDISADELTGLRSRPGGMEVAAIYRDSVLVLAPANAPKADCWNGAVHRILLPETTP